MARKSNHTTAILAYAGHVLMENRHGLVAQEHLTHATGRAERETALLLVDRSPGCTTLGADKGYDAKALVEALLARGIAPRTSPATSMSARQAGSAIPPCRRL